MTESGTQGDAQDAEPQRPPRAVRRQRQPRFTRPVLARVHKAIALAQGRRESVRPWVLHVATPGVAYVLMDVAEKQTRKDKRRAVRAARRNNR